MKRLPVYWRLVHPIYGGLVVGAWLPYIRDADARRRRKRHDTGQDRHKLGLHANGRHLAPPPTPCLLTDLRFRESQTTKRLLNVGGAVKFQQWRTPESLKMNSNTYERYAKSFFISPLFFFFIYNVYFIFLLKWNLRQRHAARKQLAS